MEIRDLKFEIKIIYYFYIESILVVIIVVIFYVKSAFDRRKSPTGGIEPAGGAGAADILAIVPNLDVGLGPSYTLDVMDL